MKWRFFASYHAVNFPWDLDVRVWTAAQSPRVFHLQSEGVYTNMCEVALEGIVALGDEIVMIVMLNKSKHKHCHVYLQHHTYAHCTLQFIVT